MIDKPSILLIGNDPPLEYLLKRYANRGGYQLQSIHAIAPDVDICQMQPHSIWFSSLDVLEAFQPQRNTFLACNVPIVVCSDNFSGFFTPHNASAAWSALEMSQLL